MKKEYKKPNMEVVSFNATENITDEGSVSAITSTGTQVEFKTINYY